MSPFLIFLTPFTKKLELAKSEILMMTLTESMLSITGKEEDGQKRTIAVQNQFREIIKQPKSMIRADGAGAEAPPQVVDGTATHTFQVLAYLTGRERISVVALKICWNMFLHFDWSVRDRSRSHMSPFLKKY